MADDRAHEIARLEAEITALRQALAPLEDMPALGEALAAQLAERQTRLDLIQSGGVNLGVGAVIGQTGDIVGRDKVKIERAVQIVQQIVLGEVAPAQLEQIRRLIGPQPGAEWDLYQAVAAGLGRANVAVTVDAQGTLQVVDDPAPERPPLDPHPFQELLLALRAAILPPDGALSAEEHQALAVRYRELIIEQFKYLKLEGLSTGTKPIVLPLEQVYVHLRAVAEVPEAADAFTPEERRLLKLLDEQRASGRIDEAELREATLRLDALRSERWTRERPERFPIAKALGDPEQRGLVILGDPGSGKSTLLQFLALSFAEGPDVAAARLQVKSADADRLPIFAPLAAYDDMLNEQPALTVGEFLPRYYDRRRTAPGLAPVFERALSEGRALVLLDGLDEVVDERRRRFVAEQTTRFVQTALVAGNRVVVTSRVYGYRVAPLAADLPHITVLDFGRKEIAVFARLWFRALKRWEGGGSLSPQAELDAQAEERLLLEEIGHNPGVEQLAVNPLLLTMLALLRRQVGTLPQRRIKLYDLYISALIESWEENRSRGARLHSHGARIDQAEAENALIELALWLQEHRPSGTATNHDLLELLGVFYLWEDQGLRVNADGVLPTQRRQAEERARQFLHDMRHFSGLLIERGQGVFGFRHLTFQEYFAGRALARMLADERWHRVEPNLHSGRWREPLLLCAARLGITENRTAEATALVTQVLEAGSDYEPQLHRDLFLAADCAADDIGLSLPLLQRIAGALWPLLLSPVPKVRRAALQRLHGLALLRAGAQARLPEVQKRLVELLLERIASRQVPPTDYQAREEAVALLTRLPAATDASLRSLLFDRLVQDTDILGATLIRVLGSLAGSNEEIRVVLLDCLAGQASMRSAAVQTLKKLAGNNADLDGALLSCLTDSRPNMRAAAVEIQGGLAARSDRVYTALFDRLTDEDPDVREAAVEALGTLVESRAEIQVALVARLVDDDASVRWRAVDTLGGLARSNAEVHPALLDRLVDSSAGVRSAAVMALSESTSFAGVRAALLARVADDDPEVRRDAIDALSDLPETDPAVRAALLACVGDTKGSVREAAVEALGELAETDVEICAALLDRVADNDVNARSAAVRHIGWLAKSNPNVRETLLDDLTDDDTELRETAARTLGRFATNSPEVRAALLKSLADEDADVRSAAAEALGRLGKSNAEVRNALLERLKHHDDNVQAAALEGLSRLAGTNAQVRNALLQSDAHVDWQTRQYLLLHQEFLSASQHSLFLRQQLDNLHCQEADKAAITILSLLAAFVTQDTILREAMLECLSNPWLTVRLVALWKLDDLAGNDAAVQAALIGCLTDPHPDMRERAARALHDLAGSTAAVQAALLGRLADQDDGARLAAVKALDGVAKSSAQIRDALIDRLQDEVPEIRTAAVVALRQLAASNTQVRKALLLCLDDDDVNVRAIAVKAVGSLAANDTTVREALLDRLNDEERYVRDDVIKALRRLVGSSVELRETLLDRLGYPAWHVRAAAVDTLAALVENDAEVQAALLGRLGDPAGPVRTAAVAAVRTLAGSDADVRAALLTCFHDPDRRVRSAAVTALNGLAESRADVCAALLKRLDDGDSHIRAAAVAAVKGLAENNTNVRDILLDHLDDDDSHIRRAIVAALAGLAGNDAAVRAALLARLSDDELHIQEAAIATLAGLADTSPEVRTALLGCLAGPLPSVCAAALKALGGQATTDAEVRAALLDHLGDPHPTIRDTTVQTLKGQDSPAIHNALLERLSDPLSQVRSAAVQVLSGLAESDSQVRAALLGLVADSDSMVRAAAIEALAPLAQTCSEVRAALLQRLDDPQPNVRAAVIAVLVEQEEDNTDLRTALLARLADSEPLIRLAAISLLLPSLTSDPGWTPRLMPLIVWEPPLRSTVEVHRTLRNPAFLHAVQRRLAQRYATQLRTDPQLRAVITGQLSAEDWRLRAAAAAILAAAGGDALRETLPQLRAALHDRRGLESWPARLEAAALLLNDDQHGEEALACTLQALAYDAEAIFPANGAAAIRKQAALTLGKLKALHHRRDVAARIAALLGSERDPQVLDALHDALSSLAAAPEAE